MVFSSVSSEPSRQDRKSSQTSWHLVPVYNEMFVLMEMISSKLLSSYLAGEGEWMRGWLTKLFLWKKESCHCQCKGTGDYKRQIDQGQFVLWIIKAPAKAQYIRNLHLQLENLENMPGDHLSFYDLHCTRLTGFKQVDSKACFFSLQWSSPLPSSVVVQRS